MFLHQISTNRGRSIYTVRDGRTARHEHLLHTIEIAPGTTPVGFYAAGVSAFPFRIMTGQS